MKTHVPFLFLILMASTPAFATALCPKHEVKAPRGEGDPWFIPEDAFTKEVAEQHLSKIRALIGPEGYGTDEVSLDRSFVYIKGWFHKNQILESMKRGETDPYVLDFCTFLKNEAYVRH